MAGPKKGTPKTAPESATNSTSAGGPGANVLAALGRHELVEALRGGGATRVLAGLPDAYNGPDGSLVVRLYTSLALDEAYEVAGSAVRHAIRLDGAPLQPTLVWVDASAPINQVRLAAKAPAVAGEISSLSIAELLRVGGAAPAAEGPPARPAEPRLTQYC